MKVGTRNLFEVTGIIFFITGIFNMLFNILKVSGFTLSETLVGVVLTQIVVFTVAILGLRSNKRQTAKEFIAGSRAKWLNTTREVFSKYASEIFKLGDCTEFDSANDVMGNINELSIKLLLSFNPNDSITTMLNDMTKHLNKMQSSLPGIFLAEMVMQPDQEQEDLDHKSRMLPLPLASRIKMYYDITRELNIIGVEMQKYFKEEWEKVKKEIE